ncbi:MAG TPA: zinc ribbon domain-containing protein [Nannocystis sp.]
MTHDLSSPSPESANSRLRPGLVLAGLAALAFALVLAAAASVGPVDAASVALATCGAALVFALGRLHALVRALARPDRLAEVGRGLGHFSKAELREEKLRLLRAIKELEFDHGMGKLSTADFESVIGTYRLRAIEVMRALEGEGELHPELQKLLAERDAARAAATAAPPAAAPPAPADAPAPATFVPDLERTSRICNHCTGHNDNDAKFCKHCGAALQRGGEHRSEAAPRGAITRSGEIG